MSYYGHKLLTDYDITKKMVPCSIQDGNQKKKFDATIKRANEKMAQKITLLQCCGIVQGVKAVVCSLIL